MNDFDLSSTNARILECSHCHEPVQADSSGGRVALKCGYCGYEDQRELVAGGNDPLEGDPYRGHTTSNARRLKIDLAPLPDGVSPRTTIPALRKLYLEQKTFLRAGIDEATRADQEFRFLHLGTLLGAQYLGAGDYLRCRAVLETLLETLSIPAYRALVLARLGRLAAMCNAPDLGDRWLAARPTGLRVAEVTSDVRVAEALIARCRGDANGVLRAIGERDTANEFVGLALPIAVALRVDAHEARGEHKLARRVWREQGRSDFGAMERAASTFGLAKKTRKQIVRRAMVALTALVLACYACSNAFAGLRNDGPIGIWLLLAFAAMVGALGILRS